MRSKKVTEGKEMVTEGKGTSSESSSEDSSSSDTSRFCYLYSTCSM